MLHSMPVGGPHLLRDCVGPPNAGPARAGFSEWIGGAVFGTIDSCPTRRSFVGMRKNPATGAGRIRKSWRAASRLTSTARKAKAM